MQIENLMQHQKPMDLFLKQQLNYQVSLFPDTWTELEKKYPNLRFQANVLFQENHLSFNPNETEELYEDQRIELLFLKILFFNSGLPREYVVSMLHSNLRKPFCYSLKNIAWDFENCKWLSFSDLVEEKYELYLQEKEEEEAGEEENSPDLEILSEFVKNNNLPVSRRNEEFDDDNNLTMAESFALDYLITFFEELIQKFRQLSISPMQVSGISKAIYLLENFGHLEFDGELRIESTSQALKGNFNSYVITIYQDEINLIKEGNIIGEFGPDGYSDEYFVIGFGEDDIDIVDKLDEWKDNFLENLNRRSPGLDVEDSIENIEEIEPQENDDDENEDLASLNYIINNTMNNA